MSRNKQKGTSFETLVADFLSDNGFPYAERRALAGVNDKGDITGTPGLVWECKNHKTMNLAGWLDETMIETANAKADYGILVAKRKGRGNPAEQYAVMPLGMMVALLKAAGY